MWKLLSATALAGLALLPGACSQEMPEEPAARAAAPPSQVASLDVEALQVAAPQAVVSPPVPPTVSASPPSSTTAVPVASSSPPRSPQQLVAAMRDGIKQYDLKRLLALSEEGDVDADAVRARRRGYQNLFEAEIERIEFRETTDVDREIFFYEHDGRRYAPNLPLRGVIEVQVTEDEGTLILTFPVGESNGVWQLSYVTPSD